MSQHDYTIENQTFPATRTDLNNVFAAIVSQNSGATAPSTTYAYMLWYDTTTDILKMRNANDDAWIDLFTIDQAADTATPSPAQRSNLIINGSMQVSQRGNAVVTQAATAYGGADRWLMYPNIAGSASSTIAQTAVTWTESKFAQGFTATTALSGGEMLFIQRIESKNTSHLADNKVTLQFKLAHDVGSTLTVQLLLQRPTTTADDYSAVTDFLGATTIGTCPTGTSSGTLFTYTSNTLTSADVSKGFQIQIRVLTASGVTNKNFYLGDVQLEAGDTVTPFEHRSYGDELARCQRYFLNYADVRNNYGMTGDLGTGSMYNASTLMCCIRFPVEMRTAPTMTHGSGTDFYRFWRNSGSDTFNGWAYWYDANRLGGALQAESNISGTAGHAGRVVVNNSAGDAGYIHLDAEL